MKTITNEEFDKKFNDNEDISEHLEFSKSIKLKDFNKLKTDTKKVNVISQNGLSMHLMKKQKKMVLQGNL